MKSLFSVLVLAAVPGALAPGATFTAAEMMKLERLSDHAVSADGKRVAYVVTETDASFTRNDDVWVAPLQGGEPKRITDHPKSDTRPLFSPDGTTLAFLSNREGDAQVFTVPVAGGEARRVTSLPTGAESYVWLDEATLLVVSDVFPDCRDDACQKERLDASSKGPRVYDSLFVRHWDTWEDGRRTHLFRVPLAGGPAVDLTPGDRDVPPWSQGNEDYAVSPDRTEIAFARNDDAFIAASTNADLYILPAQGGEAKKISTSAGYDGGPVYSPDGTRIAYRSQPRAGYESDRWRLMVYGRKTGTTTEVTPSFDRHVESFAWSADSKTIFFTAGDDATEPIYAVSAAGGTPKKLAAGTFSGVKAAGDSLVATQASLTYPAEIAVVKQNGGAVRHLTRLNDTFLATFGLKPGESVKFTGAAGKSVQAWIVKPPDFDPAKKYPLAVLIHGGPQSTWTDGWSYRWNPQVYASAGYVAFMPNPRGSPGWGQEFIEDVSADWGGRAYEDVMKGTDYAEALPYVDKGRTAALGASYGGFMVNWIAGHTDRYKVLVSHDGIFDQRAMYAATEELWFPEWEFKGVPWKNPALYDKWNPASFAPNFKTPTLVIHGEMDHRVPLEQGLGMFTALQRQGVASRLVVFPDENHWVLKPANSVRWYKEVLSWLDRWMRSRPAKASSAFNAERRFTRREAADDAAPERRRRSKKETGAAK